MPALAVNTSVNVSLPAGSSINVTGNGAWAFIATVSGREIASGSYVGPDVIGPFTRAAVVGLTASVSDGLQYSVQDFAEGNSAAAALTTEQVTALQAVVSGYGNPGIVKLSAAYQAGLVSGNPRTRALLTLASAAFGSTPTAGTVGYANTDNGTPPVITGKTFWNLTGAPYTGTQNWGPFRAEGANGYDIPASKRQGVSYYTAAAARVQGVWRVRFRTNDPEPVIYMTGSALQVPMIIDGQRCSANLVSKASGGFTQVSVNLRGLTAGYHTIELLYGNDTTLSGLYLDPRYQVQPVSARPVVAMFTDSLGNTVFGYGTNPAPGVDAFPQYVADHLGCDLRLFASGGSGYCATGSQEIFSDRVALAAASMAAAGVSPSVVVFAGGVNDSAFSAAAIQAGAEAAIAAAKAEWPLATIVTLGSWASNNTTSQANSVTAEVAIFNAAQAAGALTVPVMTDVLGAWITGTGNASSPTGTGTADLLFNSGDSTHWNTTGHQIMGHKVAHALAGALGL